MAHANDHPVAKSHHEYKGPTEGYVAKDYKHQEYPKHMPSVDGKGYVEVKDEEQEAAHQKKLDAAAKKAKKAKPAKAEKMEDAEAVDSDEEVPVV